MGFITSLTIITFWKFLDACLTRHYRNALNISGSLQNSLSEKESVQSEVLLSGYKCSNNKKLAVNVMWHVWKHVCYYIDPKFIEFLFIMLFWHWVRFLLFSNLNYQWKIYNIGSLPLIWIPINFKFCSSLKSMIRFILDHVEHLPRSLELLPHMATSILWKH